MAGTNKFYFSWNCPNYDQISWYPDDQEIINRQYNVKWNTLEGLFDISFSAGGIDKSVHAQGLELDYTKYFDGTYHVDYTIRYHLTQAAKVTLVSNQVMYPEVYMNFAHNTADNFLVESIKVEQVATGAYVQSVWSVGSPWTHTFTCSNASENYTETGLEAYNLRGANFSALDSPQEGRVLLDLGTRNSDVSGLFSDSHSVKVTVVYFSSSYFHPSVNGYFCTNSDTNDTFAILTGYGTPTTTQAGFHVEGYLSDDGLQPPVMSGTIFKECIGYPLAPVGDVVEYVWCGEACDDLNSLRNAVNAGVLGRGGFLFDEQLSYMYHMVTESIETANYPMCRPDIDEFIQCISPDSPGYYSFHSLFATVESFLGNGRRAGSNLGLIYSSGNQRTEYDFGPLEDYYKLVGPKNFIDYGVGTAQLDITWFRESTSSDWTAEPGSNFIADLTTIKIDTETDPSIISGSYLSFSGPLYTTSTTNFYEEGFHFIQMDRARMLGIRATGTTTITVEVYCWEMNFSTGFLYVLDSFTAYTEPADDYPCTNCRLAWAPTHGTDGKLYVGDPLYSDAKSEQGRIRVYTWSESTETFTWSEDITAATRVRRLGCCIGWDDSTDLLLSSEFDEDIIAFDESDSYSSPWTYTGPGGDDLGNCFSVANGKVLAIGLGSTDRTECLTITTTTVTLSGYSTTGLTNVGPWSVEPYYPNGRISGNREPKVIVMGSTGGPGRGYHLSGTTPIYSTAWNNRFHPGYSWRKDAQVMWESGSGADYTDYLYVNTSFPNLGNNALGSSLDSRTGQSNYWYDSLYTIVFWDGSSTEELVFGFGRNSLYGMDDWLYLRGSIDDGQHVTTGKYYIEYTHPLTNVQDITSAQLYMTATNVTYCIESTWFFKLGSTYYVATSATTFDSYGTLAAAKTAAADINLFASAVPNIDYGSNTEITFYYCFEKTSCPAYPLETITLTRMDLYQVPPGLDEPIINLHFGSGKRVKEAYIDVNDKIIAYTNTPADAQGLDLLVSGTFFRSLYDLSD